MSLDKDQSNSFRTPFFFEYFVGFYIKNATKTPASKI